MKSLLKAIISQTLFFCSKCFEERGIPILQYHRISDNISKEDVHSIYPDEFDKQMGYLVKNGFKVISLGEVVKLLSNGYDKKDKYVSITFDDGHKDNILFAYPILKKHNIKATVFVISDYVGMDGWLDETGNLQEKKTKNSQKWYLLSWNELRLSQDCFAIESHGKSHKRMDRLEIGDIKRELSEPFLKIQEEIKTAPSFFCYPYGCYNEEIINQVKSSGYKAACSSNKGINVYKESDLWQLKRNEIGSGISITQFKLALTGGITKYDYISSLFHRYKLVK